MRSRLMGVAVSVAAAAVLSGCGDSTPQPQSSGVAPSTSLVASSAPAPTGPTSAAFAAVNVAALQGARAVADCSLDAINGDSAQTSNTISHTAQPVLAGWAGDPSNNSVPVTLQIVLKGAQDFAASVPTGYPIRADVAKYKNIPAYRASGYALKADFSAVALGQYSMLLLYTGAGKAVSCDTHRQIVVQ